MVSLSHFPSKHPQQVQNMTWENAMKILARDNRYGVVKSLGQRKQIFTEWVVQKKKQEKVTFFNSI